MTPSEINGIGTGQSPLAKRKRIAASRSGSSKLKEAISADDLATKENATLPEGEIEEDDEDDDEDEDEEVLEDDFLARELEEEWG